jgi:hypothetical protein
MVFVAVGVAIALTVWLFVSVPPAWSFPEETKSVGLTIARLEACRRQHGEYPDSLHFPLDHDAMFYVRKPDGAYFIGFNAGFDNDEYCYDGGRRRWMFHRYSYCQSR